MQLFILLILVKILGCEFCPLEFPSRQDRIQHTTTHFKSKSCTTCHKLLLCINGEWYELHASPGCVTDNDFQNLPKITHTDTIDTKTEAFNFGPDLQMKIEVSDNSDDFNVDEDYRTISDSLLICESDIEAKILPPIVQSLAKLKTNLTISRPKAKKRKDEKIIELSVKPDEKIKQACDKTVFPSLIRQTQAQKTHKSAKEVIQEISHLKVKKKSNLQSSNKAHQLNVSPATKHSWIIDHKARVSVIFARKHWGIFHR